MRGSEKTADRRQTTAEVIRDSIGHRFNGVEVMKIRESFSFRWLRNWLAKLRDEYQNWRVRRAW